VIRFNSCCITYCIFISSQASQAALKDHTVYCASKAALDMITRVMALELGCHKVCVEFYNKVKNREKS